MAQFQGDDSIALAHKERITGDKECARLQPDELRKGRFEVVVAAGVQYVNGMPERSGRCQNFITVRFARKTRGVDEHCEVRGLWLNVETGERGVSRDLDRTLIVERVLSFDVEAAS